MKGINYMKGKDDPVALPEEEYPEWLWRCLDAKKIEGEEDGALGDEFCKVWLLQSLPSANFYSQIQETSSKSSQEAEKVGGSTSCIWRSQCLGTKDSSDTAID